jgi:folylpolyglutamate synthase/dihydropteroate synthase
VKAETPTARLSPLPGAHQAANAAVAVTLLEEARAAGLAVDLSKVAAGIARTRWPGRLQRCPAGRLSSSTAPTTLPPPAPSRTSCAGKGRSSSSSRR